MCHSTNLREMIDKASENCLLLAQEIGKTITAASKEKSITLEEILKALEINTLSADKVVNSEKSKKNG